MVAILAAVAAAAAYALASVLQQRAAAAEAPSLSLRAGLLFRLAASRRWLLGLVADVAAYGLQFVALGLGALAVVQPLLVSGLLIALPLGARFDQRRLTGAEWRGAIYVVVGLGMFLVVAHPAAGVADAAGRAWILLSAATLIPVAILVVSASSWRGPARARALAAATGILYGYTAALTKASAHLLRTGLGPLLTAWQPYALAACGLTGMLLAQSAFQAAPLDTSLPILTVVDPLVSVAIGARVFHEALANGPRAVGLEAAAIALLTLGVARLAATERLPARRADSRPRPGR